MNYDKLYSSLMEMAKTQTISDGEYTEVHHIVPRCLGGTNDKDNLVVLTAKQHFLAHKILVKKYEHLTKGKEDKTPYYKMLRAFTAMMWAWGCPNENKRAPNICGKLYEQWKKDLSKDLSRSTKERFSRLTNEQILNWKQKISTQLKSNPKVRLGLFSGRKHSAETLAKMHETHLRTHHQSGNTNSQYGKHWWTNPETGESHSFRNENVPNGWIRGRRCTFSESGIKHIKDASRIRAEKNLIWFTNGVKNIRLPKNADNPIGYRRGFTMKTPSKSSRTYHTDSKRQRNHEKILSVLREQYQFWITHTWKEFVERFDYKFSRANFIQNCKRHLGSEWCPKRF